MSFFDRERSTGWFHGLVHDGEKVRLLEIYPGFGAGPGFLRHLISRPWSAVKDIYATDKFRQQLTAGGNSGTGNI